MYTYQKHNYTCLCEYAVCRYDKLRDIYQKINAKESFPSNLKKKVRLKNEQRNMDPMQRLN